MSRKLTNFRLPEDLIVAMRDRAEAENISVTELLIRFCQQGLGENVGTSESVNQAVSTELLYSAIEEAIAPVAKKVETLAAELEKRAA